MIQGKQTFPTIIQTLSISCPLYSPATHGKHQFYPTASLLSGIGSSGVITIYTHGLIVNNVWSWGREGRWVLRVGIGSEGTLRIDEGVESAFLLERLEVVVTYRDGSCVNERVTNRRKKEKSTSYMPLIWYINPFSQMQAKRERTRTHWWIYLGLCVVQSSYTNNLECRSHYRSHLIYQQRFQYGK